MKVHNATSGPPKYDQDECVLAVPDNVTGVIRSLHVQTWTCVECNQEVGLLQKRKINNFSSHAHITPYHKVTRMELILMSCLLKIKKIKQDLIDLSASLIKDPIIKILPCGNHFK